jgi:hypothetical protein
MRERIFVTTAAAALLVAACSSLRQPLPPSSPTSAASSATLQNSQAAVSPSPVRGGCGSTQVFAGPGPDADLGLADNPWAPATPTDAGIVAYFWYPPPGVVFASRSSNDAPKILWISHGEQPGDLHIKAHPVGATSPIATFDVPPASSPAGNYPSGIELPSAGCWHLDLAIGSTQAAIDLLVAPAPTSSSRGASPTG